MIRHATSMILEYVDKFIIHNPFDPEADEKIQQLARQYERTLKHPEQVLDEIN